MPLSTLVSACQEDTRRFFRRESVQADSCFELFRRAIGERSQPAWEAIYAQYRGIVLSWVQQHPAFPTTRDDAEYWLNRAFERLWSALPPERFSSFAELTALLRYLKMCVHSVLTDEQRRQARVQLEALSEETVEALEPADTEHGVIGDMAGRDLWNAISAELHDEAEHLVAHLCFVLDLKPQEIQRRRPDRFATVADVYRVKRNLIERLRRNPHILEIRR